MDMQLDDLVRRARVAAVEARADAKWNGEEATLGALLDELADAIDAQRAVTAEAVCAALAEQYNVARRAMEDHIALARLVLTGREGGAA